MKYIEEYEEQQKYYGRNGCFAIIFWLLLLALVLISVF